jgi:apolipoprotein N-acyltransferase
MISLFPLFIAIDRIHVDGGCAWKRKFWYIFLACFGTGSIAALIGVPWLTYAAQVFGNLPLAVALLITGLGYGLEVTLVLFICFGVPMLFIRRRQWWDLPVRLSFFLIVEPYYPRIFHWSFGGLTFTEFPLISQLADVIGSPGLGMYNIGFSLLLLLLWRWKVEQLQISVIVIRRLLAAYLILWGIGLIYGVWRVQSLGRHLDQGLPLHIAALQPNFSFQQLYSNALNASARQRNVHELLRYSIDAINSFPANSLIPKLVVWPESTYPSGYFKDVTLQPLIQHFARHYGTSVLFHSVDWDITPSGRRYYGIAVLVGADGKVKGRYNKIFRIPFGEYIPGADWFPTYAHWVRRYVSHLSEFERGEDFTVFELCEDIRFSAPICFDIFSPTILRNMARNGADLGINLCNLIWFGNTTAADHLKMTIRWRAVENRIPVLLVSNNGESVFVNELGMNVGNELELFERGSLTHTVFLKRHFSIYRQHAGWIHFTFLLLFLLTLIYGNSKGKILHNH